MSGRYVSEIELRTNIEKVLSQLKETQDKVDKLEGKEYKVNLDIDTKTLESAIQKLDKMLDSLGKGTGDFKQFENLSKELSAITSEVKDFSKAFGKVDDSGAKTLLSSIQNIDKSLSDLSQHILNVNKNMGNIGGNTNGAVRQVENIGNAATEAAKQVDKLAEVQSKLGGNKTNISSGDNPKKDAFQGENQSQKVTENLEKENNVLNENTQKIKENTQAHSENQKKKNVSSQNQKNNAEKENYKQAVSDIKSYESALNRLSTLRAKQANARNGKDFSAEIKAAEEEVAKLSPAFKEAQNVISSFASKSSEELKEIGASAKSVTEQVEKIASLNSGKLSPTLESAYDNFAINAKGNLDKYEKWNPKTEGYSKIIAEYSDALNKFNEIKKKIQDNGSIASKEDISTINQLIQKINELNTKINKLGTPEKGTKEFKQQALLTDLNRLRNEFPGMSKDISARIEVLEKKFKDMGESVNFDKARAEIAELRNELMNTEGATKNLWSSIKDKAFYGLASQIAMYFSFNDIVRYVREGIQEVREMDTAFTELRKVSDDSVSSLKEYESTTYDTADAVGATAQTIMNSTADWKRLGRLQQTL